MFVSVGELALQASPNSFFAFIFCNLIIFTIVLRLRSGLSDSETQDAFPGSYTYRNAERWSHQVHHVNQPVKQVEEEEEELALVQVTEARDGEIGGEEDCEHNSLCEYKHEDETAEAENEDNDEEDNRDHDEFTRRVEDFIAKVNRKWREEYQGDRSWPRIMQEAA